MARVKKTSRKTIHTPKSSSLSKKLYGIEHEFVIITGGGFLVIALGMILFFSF